MRIIGASKATGGYPCPPGFNHRLRGAYRWFSGRPLNGHRYTDATGFRAGTFAVDISGHAAAYHYWPGYKKFLATRLPVMAIPAMAILAITGHGLAVAICLAITLAIVAKLATAMAKDRGHRKNVVEPVAIAVAKILNKRHIPGHGHDWVAIPRDFRDNPMATVAIQIPASFGGDKGEMARVTKAVMAKLADPDIVATWELAGARPYVEFHRPPQPPKLVTLAQAMSWTCTPDELILGAGPNGYPVPFSLTLESPHLMIAGGSGVGKSEFIAHLVGQLMRRGYGVAVLDAKWVSHMWLRKTPGVLYASRVAELHEALVWLHQELLSRAERVSLGGNPGVPLVVVLEEMNSASDALRSYWQEIKPTGVTGMSPALKALAALASMGREMMVHVIMAGQNLSARAVGGPEARESFAGRAMARATRKQWRMLAEQIKNPPLKHGDPGRWHIVVGDTVREFQAPFCDLKNKVSPDSEAELIAWATGGQSIPDVPAMMAGEVMTQLLTREHSDSSAGSSPAGMSLSAYVASRPSLTLTQLQNWRKRYAQMFPEPIGAGEKGAQLYDPADLDLFVLTREGVA